MGDINNLTDLRKFVLDKLPNHQDVSICDQFCIKRQKGEECDLYSEQALNNLNEFGFYECNSMGIRIEKKKNKYILVGDD